MLILLNLLSLIVFSYGKSIDSTNWTSAMPTTTMTTLTVPTTMILTTEPSTTTMMSTTMEVDEQTTTQFVDVEKPYEYQLNFSRTDDSIFLSLHGNSSNLFYSINNSFHPSENNNSSQAEIQVNEHTILSNINSYLTKIRIYFNGTQS